MRREIIDIQALTYFGSLSDLDSKVHVDGQTFSTSGSCFFTQPPPLIHARSRTTCLLIHYCASCLAVNVPLHNWTARVEGSNVFVYICRISLRFRDSCKSRIPISQVSHCLNKSQSFLFTLSPCISGDVGLAEFVDYVKDHEKNLRLQFSTLDKNKDGKVDLEEMIVAFKELGIIMDRAEALRLFNR